MLLDVSLTDSTAKTPFDEQRSPFMIWVLRNPPLAEWQP
jgi:hypothetical protein